MEAVAPKPEPEPWWRQVTRYQWTVLLVASLGWIFDVFEGQIFVASMREAMPSLLSDDATPEEAERVSDWAFAAFLIGGALGGVLFGMLSDRIGRAKTMIITILVYSIFTSLTAFAQTPGQVIALRFLVALGVAGEWAVASAMVAEVFPRFARVKSLGIFHATSAFGSYLAIAAGYFIVANPGLRDWDAFPGANWRIAFLLGAVPALLTIWIRLKLREPDRWKEAKRREAIDPSQKTGRVLELLSPGLRRRAFVGVCLAAVGLATFWGVKVYGKDLMRGAAERAVIAEHLPAEASDPQQREEVLEANFQPIKRWEMTGLFLVITGGLVGMLCFGPISERKSRRWAFGFFHAGGFLSGVVLFGFFAGESLAFYAVALPVFGFLVSGMHAGYAVYFPELFPSRLRSTGAGFCFNAGRLLAAPVLIVRGILRDDAGWSLGQTAAALSFLFLLGFVVLLFAPETRDRELPE